MEEEEDDDEEHHALVYVWLGETHSSPYSFMLYSGRDKDSSQSQTERGVGLSEESEWDLSTCTHLTQNIQ